MLNAAIAETYLLFLIYIKVEFKIAPIEEIENSMS